MFIVYPVSQLSVHGDSPNLNVLFFDVIIVSRLITYVIIQLILVPEKQK